MEKAIEIQKENINSLLQLVKDNPDLPILPMVDYEIVADDCYSYWTGSWGNAEIDSYCIANERVLFLSDGTEEIFEQINGTVPDYVENEKEYIDYMVMALDWTKAIIVYIELPN